MEGEKVRRHRRLRIHHTQEIRSNWIYFICFIFERKREKVTRLNSFRVRRIVPVRKTTRRGADPRKPYGERPEAWWFISHVFTGHMFTSAVALMWRWIAWCLESKHEKKERKREKTSSGLTCHTWLCICSHRSQNRWTPPLYRRPEPVHSAVNQRRRLKIPRCNLRCNGANPRSPLHWPPWL